MGTTPTSLHDLATRVVDEARRKQLRLTTAESCTSGAVSTLLSDIPGAGDVLEGGFVSYSKSFKAGVLKVDRAVLETETAVSEPVALAMVQGALRLAPRCEIGIAITGVCGPKPDDDGNPVGLAYIAAADRNGRTLVKRLELDAEPSGRVRGAMIEESLKLLSDFLEQTG